MASTSIDASLNPAESEILYALSHIMKNLFMPYAKNKGAEQSADQRSLMSTFVVCCQDCIISLVSISDISSL